MKLQNGFRKIVLGILVFALELSLSACGKSNFILPPEAVSFQQVPITNNRVDILFVADDSSSMVAYRQQMATQAQAIVNQLNSAGLDYHLAVTTTSVGAGYQGGGFVGGQYLTSQTPNVGAALGSLLGNNAIGSDLEQGLLSMENALSPANLTGANGKFIRPDAKLAIVVISDDDDYSSGTIASYQTFLNSLKPSTSKTGQQWTMNYLGSTSTTTTCQNFVNVGQKFISLAGASNGNIQNICNANWSKVMTNLQVEIVSMLTNYYFSIAPNPATISVTVNGNSVPQDPANGWNYVTSTNSLGAPLYYIHFNGNSVPSLNATVNVSFVPASAN